MRIKNVAGPLLLVIPLLLTITIGVYFNNFNNNGFATPASAGFSGCPTLIQWNDPDGLNGEICQAYNQTYTGPCQTPSNATYCGFQTASVLNPNSLYTCILQVSWQCFVNGITGSTSGPLPSIFQFFNQPSAPIYNICGNINGTSFTSASVAGSQFALLSCDQVFNTGHRVPANQSTAYTQQWNCSDWTPHEPTGFSPQENFVYLGCNFIPSHTIPVVVNNTYSAILGFNYSQFGNVYDVGKCIGGSLPFNLCQIQGEAMIFTDHTNTTALHDALDCYTTIKAANSGSSGSVTAECKAWINAVQQENNGTGGSLFFLAQLMALLGGIALTLIGFGLGISGGAVTFNFSVTPNSQGTRYAQVLGFALLVITPIDAEFAGPYTVLAVLGIGTIILALFTVFEFFGIFFMVSQPIAG